MNQRHRQAAPSCAYGTAARGHQSGVYALEWAIIFPIFFLLLYGILSYGLTFLVRESMQYAVEEGARAALRYPSSSTLNGATAPTWAHRRTEAQQATAQALNWLPPSLRPEKEDISFTICHVSDSNCNLSTPLQSSISCDVHTPCLVLVAYRISDYQGNAIAPAIPGLGMILPSNIEAKASILLDRRML